MKLRHTAALALVGWYLMVPPVTTVKGSDRYYRVVTKAAIGEWEYSETFETRDECESGRLTVLQNLSGTFAESSDLSNSNGTGVQGSLAQAQHAAFLFSKCVASNDPRLKSD